MTFLRILFVSISLLFMTSYMATLPFGVRWVNTLIGLGIGLLFSLLFFSIESFFRKYHLKTFHTTVLGLFVGFLFGKALVILASTLFDVTHMSSTLLPETRGLIHAALYLLGTYLGTALMLHFSHEFAISIPFIKLSSSPSKQRDLLVDTSALSDARILDLASSGLVDHALVIPRFLVKQLYVDAESKDEMASSKAKRCLETLKKLEALPDLGLRYEEVGASQQVEELFVRLIQLARVMDANILTADPSQIKIPAVEGIKIVNLHALSNALKPLMQAGEALKVKIQRLGKEPNQGVGYLEDGTMVVVNGGGDYIRECIDVQVLSVKHTSSGRMIFCNTLDEMPARGNELEV